MYYLGCMSIKHREVNTQSVQFGSLFNGLKIWFKREAPNFLPIVFDLQKNLISTLHLLEF